jgi:hypothetical protein
MNEVSCKAAFELLLVPLAQKGITAGHLVEGTTVSPATIQNKKARIDWADFVTIMHNVRPHLDDEELIDIGRTFLSTSGLRFALVIGRLLYSIKDFYRWMMKPREGVGNQFFTCVHPTFRDVSDHEIEVDLTLPDGFEVCWEFLLTSQGNFEELPRMLGLSRAQVTLTRLPNGGRYRIVIPKSVPLFTRIRRWLTWPFTVRAAARELQAAHESLLEQYQQLEMAQSMIAHQAAHLRTAHTLNDLILRDLEISRLLDTVAKALVEEAGFSWAELSLLRTEKEPAPGARGAARADRADPGHRHPERALPHQPRAPGRAAHRRADPGARSARGHRGAAAGRAERAPAVLRQHLSRDPHAADAHHAGRGGHRVALGPAAR